MYRVLLYTTSGRDIQQSDSIRFWKVFAANVVPVLLRCVEWVQELQALKPLVASTYEDW